MVENWPGSAMINAVRSKGERGRKLINETRYYVTSLRTGVHTLLQQVRDHWSIETSWHWPGTPRLMRMDPATACR